MAEDFDGQIQASTKIGHQRLDQRCRRLGAHGGNHVDKVLRAAIAQIVAVDAGNHHIAQFEAGNALGQLGRFVGVGRQRLAVPDIAKRAAARANIAKDHEGRGAAPEALADIRTSRFFANRVQLLVAQHAFDFAEAPAIVAGLDANPCRFAQGFGGDDLDRNARRLQLAFFLDPGHAAAGLCCALFTHALVPNN